MKINVDRSRCVGAGQCVLTAPALFDQGEEDGLVEVLDAEPDDTQAAAAKMAAQVCPSGTITLIR
ncbi:MULTISPECIES: ferredoxin [Streptomyces]|jgi:ferredoxin|uniref:ferredoxin n=1 Tax=Streptomyces TaxID=1883 RepID=UPI0009C1A01C|nr:ferredoxin [Streptomyces viridosporus]BDC03526.1 Ferredoxin [Streptomyces achromogenes subsp. streptozoticus]